MKSRAIRSRENARKIIIQPEPVKKVQSNAVVVIDPKDKGIVNYFKSIEDAVSEGYSSPNIIGAIKRKTKYKGYLWEYK